MAVLLKEDNGNLRKYLKEDRSQLYENAKPQETIHGMALDVAKGMSYLAELKVLIGKNVRIFSWAEMVEGDYVLYALLQPDILHRCLSAEHVLVSKNGVCKLTGFGFAEHIREREEYERKKEVCHYYSIMC